MFCLCARSERACSVSGALATPAGPLGTSLSRLPSKLRSRKHRVNKVHVGAYRLLSERPPCLRSLLLQATQLLAQPSGLLCLGAKVLYYPVEEVLGKLGVHLLNRNATIRRSPLGLDESVGELLGRLV